MNYTRASLVLIAVILAGCVSGPSTLDSTSDPMPAATSQARPTNIIFFISDGAGPASFTLTRDYLRAMNIRENLYLDEILTGTVATWSASHPITGSGPAATAMSAGVKSNRYAIGVDADGNPVKTIIEKAEAAGLSTGIIVTREVTDATPASFTAHVANRYDNKFDIAVQQLETGIDLLVGGGRENFLPLETGGVRPDGRNLIVEARAKGYNVVTTRDEWDAATALPVLGLLADDKLAFDLDRDAQREPSLSEMTNKAINMLSANEKGFFLMVEGSRIDLAGHDNDAAAHVHDMIAFDEAVKAALDFARQDGNTLVLSTSDHETGGLTIGRNYQWYPEVISRVQTSHDFVVAEIQAERWRTRDIIKQYQGIDSLSVDEVAALDSSWTRNEFNRTLGKILGDRALIDWTSLSHTAVDVNIYAYGPGSQSFHGHFDNTHIGKTLPVLLGLD